MTDAQPSPAADAQPAAADGQSTAERAYHHVRTRLLDGTWPGGMLLSEGVVAIELGLSRTPVREAFLRLQSEGFLRLYPKRGAQVVPIAPGEARDVLAARVLFEHGAVDALAARGPEALTAAAAELRAAFEHPDQHPVEAGREFHLTLLRAAGNPVLTSLYETLWDRQIRISAAATATRAHAAEDHAEHRALADALAVPDAALARSLITAHADSLLSRIR
ncbi:GntR family transcriptional regulator [Kitasatospora cheerisanensis]|uniref:GntR family transcriptional regulator n=1 Tax=Kitasatospora cheerisanensis KCTC 2395 TaxID=1348663 RepID=A0A066Z562_9ACTN|nr:GntR family transcriptional regulator [Kitasatospora cheerisanensis]KDN85290.1 GntR family transcriptional regulator [Kitasatospora cheerisanensis KCTC 2395]